MPFCERVDDLLRLLVIEFFLKIFIAEALAPKLPGLSQILWPGLIPADHGVSVATVELENFGTEQSRDKDHPLLEAMKKPIVDLAGGTHVPRFYQFTKGFSIGRKLLQIGAEEIKMLAVQAFHVTIQKL